MSNKEFRYFFINYMLVIFLFLSTLLLFVNCYNCNVLLACIFVAITIILLVMLIMFDIIRKEGEEHEI